MKDKISPGKRINTSLDPKEIQRRLNKELEI